MRWATHYPGGALAGIAVSAALGLSTEQALGLTVGAVAASTLPDIDAKVNIGNDYDHRSLPHSLLFGGGGFTVLALIAYLWLRANTPELGSGLLEPSTLTLLAPGAAVGYLSHLALDAPNRSGIWLLAPGGKRLAPPKQYAVKTGGMVELLIRVALIVACVVLGLAVLGDANLGQSAASIYRAAG